MKLTTNHPASSYGQPILLISGIAYGPCDRTPSGMSAAQIVRTDTNLKAPLALKRKFLDRAVIGFRLDEFEAKSYDYFPF
jgi:hypothetical protein